MNERRIIMKKWIEKGKEKKGWVTLVILLVVSVSLPIFLFFFVENSYLFSQKDKAKDIADNIASSAVRSIDQTLLEEEQRVVINESEAYDVAMKLFQSNYKLNDDLSATESSHLRENPTIKIDVRNSVGQFTTAEGLSYQVTKPTVIVYTSVKPKGIFFNRSVKIQTFSVYEIETRIVETDTNGNPKVPTVGEVVSIKGSVQYTIPNPNISHIPNQGSFNGWKQIKDSKNTILYSGNLIKGKFNGYGILYDVNGFKVYDGNWTNGVYDKFGILYNPNGTTFYNGDTKLGVPYGYGTYYGADGNLDYQGDLVDGYREGYGTSYDDKGTPTSGNQTDASNPSQKSNKIELLFHKIELK